MALTIPLVNLEDVVSYGLEAEDSMVTDLILQLHTPQIESAPGALSVSVVDGGNTVDFHFEIDGEEVFVIEPDSDGGLDLVTVPVPDLVVADVHIMQPGTHTVTAIQGSSVGSADFEIINPPPLPQVPPGADLPPVAVPGAIQPTGYARWVFQDLAVDGLGSWIMPMNPSESDPPYAARNLSAGPSSAGNVFHVWEGEYQPEEWSFGGVCPTETMREKLEEYYALNRRFYIHDHRSRAWTVTFQSLELVPRLSTNWEREQTEQFHDYEATVLVTHPEWVQL